MRKLIFIAALLAAGAGCSPLQPVKNEPNNTFALEAHFDQARAAPSATAPVIAVAMPRARPGFDSPRMAYVRKTHELEYFTRNQWVDTPARMLAPLLMQALETGGRFRAVVTPQSGATASLRLDSEIVRLQQDFSTTPSRVRFTLRVQLLDLPGRQVVATREFDAVENAPSDDPYGGVVAANRALRRVLDEVAAFCADSLKP